MAPFSPTPIHPFRTPSSILISLLHHRFRWGRWYPLFLLLGMVFFAILSFGFRAFVGPTEVSQGGLQNKVFSSLTDWLTCVVQLEIRLPRAELCALENRAYSQEISLGLPLNVILSYQIIWLCPKSPKVGSGASRWFLNAWNVNGVRCTPVRCAQKGREDLSSSSRKKSLTLLKICSLKNVLW